VCACVYGNGRYVDAIYGVKGGAGKNVVNWKQCVIRMYDNELIMNPTLLLCTQHIVKRTQKRANTQIDACVITLQEHTRTHMYAHYTLRLVTTRPRDSKDSRRYCRWDLSNIHAAHACKQLKRRPTEARKEHAFEMS